MEQAGGTKTREGVPIDASEVDAILERLFLVSIDSLRCYERPDRARIGEIAFSLKSSGVLINPVVVDRERQLLIDGHHRVAAFEWLGLERIPAFTVDYFSDEVEVKGWHHLTDAPREAIEPFFEIPGGQVDGQWVVHAMTGGSSTVTPRKFATARDSADYLDHITCCLRAGGWNVTLTTEEDARRAGRMHSCVQPVVEKAEVIQAVESKEFFPPEVNRHLVACRPLGLRIPVSAMASEERLRSHVHHQAAKSVPIAVDSGFRDGERAYEERVTFFSADDARLKQ